MNTTPSVDIGVLQIVQEESATERHSMGDNIIDKTIARLHDSGLDVTEMVVSQRVLRLSERGYLELGGHKDPKSVRHHVTDGSRMFWAKITAQGEDALERGIEGYKNPEPSVVHRNTTFQGNVHAGNLATGDGAVQSLQVQVSVDEMIQTLRQMIESSSEMPAPQKDQSVDALTSLQKLLSPLASAVGIVNTIGTWTSGG